MRVLKALSRTLGLGLLFAASSSPCWANANGIETWGTVCVLGKCVPTGTMRSTVTGTGLNIEQVRAEFNVVKDPLCNWKVDVAVDDLNGRRMYTYHGATHYDCNYKGTVKVYPGRVPRAGNLYVTLYRNGSTQRARERFSIVP